MNKRNSIAWWRNRQKVSQEELSKHLRINRALMSQIETGIVIPPDDLVVLISRYLDCLPTDLLKVEKSGEH